MRAVFLLLILWPWLWMIVDGCRSFFRMSSQDFWFDVSRTGSESDFPAREKVTFVTVPRPQLLDYDVRVSVLVLSLWLRLPDVQVVLVANRSTYDVTKRIVPTVEGLFGTGCLTFSGEVAYGFAQRPLVREWFYRGVNSVQDGYLCFLNSDILPTRKWLHTAKRIFKTLNSRETTVILGVRTHVRRVASHLFSLDPSRDSFLDLFERYCERWKGSNNGKGMDLAMFHKRLSCLDWRGFPDFVVGLCVWDNYFQSWSTSCCQTVTMNFDPMLFHLDHGENACNPSNIRMFRQIVKVKGARIGYHYHATWRLDFRRGLLHSKARTLRLQPVQFDGFVSTRQEF